MHPENYAEHPDTCADFWGMVSELGTRTIVMLGAGERGYTGCARYFPNDRGEAKYFGKFQVDVMDKEEMGEHVVVRTMGLKVSTTHFCICTNAK